MPKKYQNTPEFNSTIQWIYLELKQVAEDPEWDEEELDENWLDDQYQFLVDYIQRSLTNRTWAVTEDIVAADLIGSALNTILEMSEISFKEACIECMSFLEGNYNL